MTEPLQPQDVIVRLETLDWVPGRPEERDGIDFEPALWSVFVKIDGSTVRVSADDGHAVGTATVRGTTGSGLGVGELVAGRSLPIPAAIGRWTDRIVPIPFGDVLLLPGFFGVALIVVAPGVIGSDALEVGHARLVPELQKRLDELIAKTDLHNLPSEQDIQDLVDAVTSVVHDAVVDAMALWREIVSVAADRPWFGAAFALERQDALPADPLAQVDIEMGFRTVDPVPGSPAGAQHFFGVTGSACRQERAAGTGVIGRFGSGIRAVAGFADETFQHVAVATGDGAVSEIWWQGGAAVNQDNLAHFGSGVVALAGYCTPDGIKHVIVATEDRALTELWWEAGQPNQGSLGSTSGPVVALAGYAAGDSSQHVIAATADGTVTEFWWLGGAVSQNLLTRIDGRIVDVAGYWSADGVQHVIVASGDLDLTELWWRGSGSVSSGPLTGTNPDGDRVPVLGPGGWKHVLGIGAYFAPRQNRAAGIQTESEQHVVVALSNGTLREIRWTVGEQDVPVHDDLLAIPGLQPSNLDARIGPLADAYVDATGIQHAIVATRDGSVQEVWWTPVPPIFVGGVLAGG